MVANTSNLWFGGWARKGSHGIINDSIDEANVLSKTIVKHLFDNDPVQSKRQLSSEFEDWLQTDKSYRPSWGDWQRIRLYEKEVAFSEGRLRNKVRNTKELKENLKIIGDKYDERIHLLDI